MVQIVLQSNVLGSGHSVKDTLEKLQSSPSQHSGQSSFRGMPQTETPSAPNSVVAGSARDTVLIVKAIKAEAMINLFIIFK